MCKWINEYIGIYIQITNNACLVFFWTIRDLKNEKIQCLMSINMKPLANSCLKQIKKILQSIDRFAYLNRTKKHTNPTKMQFLIYLP